MAATGRFSLPYLLLFGAAGLVVQAAQLGGAAERWAFVTAAAAIATWVAARKPGGQLLVALIVAGVAGRALFVLTEPESSDDVYRYLFEGRVVASGDSPYHYPPDSPRFASLRDDHVHPKINHPEIASIYLPTAQGLFLAAHHLGGTASAMKCVFLVFEILAASVLGAVLLRRGATLLPVALFFWNPALILESAEGAHVDAAGASLLLLALTVPQGRDLLRSALIALSSLVKPVAAPLLIFSLRSRRTFLASVAGCFAVMLAAALFSAHLWLMGAELHPDRVAAVDWRARILLTKEGTRIETEDPNTLRPRPHDGLVASRVLGRYHVARPGAVHGPQTFTFDGRQTVVYRDADRDTSKDFGFWIDQEAQRIIVHEPPNGGTFARLAMSEDRVVMRGTIHDDDGIPQEVIALKGAETPFMGYRHFFARWDGFALLHPTAERLLGSRRAAQIFVGCLIAALAVILFMRRASLPASAAAIALTAVAFLPVVHAWYTLWILPGAVMLERKWIGAGLAALVACAPLLHA